MAASSLIRSIVTISICGMLAGCGFDHDERITGKYRLIAVDLLEQMSVSRSVADGNAIGRIGETVFAVGWNDRYIVAKQHPDNNRKITRYYYLDMTRDSDYAEPSQSVTGPLTEAEFKDHMLRLGLPEFRKTIKELE